MAAGLMEILMVVILTVEDTKGTPRGQLTFGELWRKHQEMVKPQLLGFKNFSCPEYKVDKKYVPRNVHTVRVENIGVMAALGDSITAGTGVGATSDDDLPSTKYRSLSFAIGGGESLRTVLTLPNIVRRFNADIYGASTSQDPRFNVAVAGARARDMPAQAKELIRRIASRSHLRDSWKVITIFIGINDICHACYSDMESFRLAPTPWIREIDRAIDLLSKSLTNTVVNVISVAPMWQLRQYEAYEDCPTCRCVSSSYKFHETTDAVNRKYQIAVNTLTGKYDRSDFTVVIQPFLTNMVIPAALGMLTPDLSFVAPDCFHFGRRWHAAAAAALWNNMLQPIGSKSNRTNLAMISLKCPSSDCPYIRTAVNSISCADSFLLTKNLSISTPKSKTPSSSKPTAVVVAAKERRPTTAHVIGLWILLCILLSLAVASAGFLCWYRRKHRRGDMNLGRLASRHYSEDPHAPLIAVNELRGGRRDLA